MGYHYLMRIANCLNELVHFSAALVKKIREKTVRGFIRFIFETCKGRWFKPGEILRIPSFFKCSIKALSSRVVSPKVH